MYSENSTADDADNKEIDEDKTAVDRTDIELYNEQLWQAENSAEN